MRHPPPHPPYLLFFSHGTLRENLTGNLFHLFFAGLFSLSFSLLLLSWQLRLILDHYLRRFIYFLIIMFVNFFKELVVLKPDGKLGDIFVKIQQAAAKNIKYSN